MKGAPPTPPPQGGEDWGYTWGIIHEPISIPRREGRKGLLQINRPFRVEQLPNQSRLDATVIFAFFKSLSREEPPAITTNVPGSTP